MVLSSVIFGLIHLTNLLSGAPFGATILQILNAFGMGMFLCAVFLCSGSLWPGIIIHTLFDTFAFLDVPNIAEGGHIATDYSFSWTDLIVFAFIAVSIAAGLYLVRPGVRAEITALRNRKWNRSSD